jgi:hypothetical protein
MTDPLVLKSPSNQSNILDISILFAVMVFFVLSLIKLLPPLLIAGLILLQCKLHLVNWDKKKNLWQNEFWFIHFAEDFMFDFLYIFISGKFFFLSLMSLILLVG